MTSVLNAHHPDQGYCPKFSTARKTGGCSMRVTPLSVAVIVVRVFLGASILLSMLRQPALAQQSTPPKIM
jgi:hypothetical protein